MPSLTVLFFWNSTNFAKDAIIGEIAEINQDAIIAKISVYEETSKFPKWTKKNETIY